MDTDTIFPALSCGEQIIDKYRHDECCNSVETIVILTNVRLLICWKETIWCIFHQYLYSSIELNSILRIDEFRPTIRLLYFWFLMTLGSFITMISGFSSKSPSAGIVGLLLFCGVLLYAFLYYLNLKNRYVSLSGTFGKQTLKFEMGIARQLEARLSEMMHQTKTQQLNQATNLSGSPSSYGIPVQSQTAYSGGAQQYGYNSTPDNIVLS
jgi:hypothetical protein